MIRWRAIVAVSVVLALAGCGSLPAVAKKPGEEPESGGGGQAGEYSGRWTLEQDGKAVLVFEVEDDGQKVSGKRVEGEGFEDYVLDLQKQPDGSLKGKAKFKDSKLGKSYETSWKVKKDGAGLAVDREWLEIDDKTGAVDQRGTETVAFAFAPAGGGGGGGQPEAAPAMDYSQMIFVMPSYKHLLAEEGGIAVGQWIQVDTATEMSGVPPQKSSTRTAVVAETADAWVIEMDNQAGQKDLLLAVFVDKQSGRTLKAFWGSRGKQAKEKEVPPPPPEQTSPEPTDTEITVQAGTFPAKYLELQGSKSWTGREGDAEGVPLKSEYQGGGDELATLETGQSYSASGNDYACRHLVYTSGNEWWWANKDSKPFLNQTLVRILTKTPQMTSDTKLVGVGTDAKPEMDYPR